MAGRIARAARRRRGRKDGKTERGKARALLRPSVLPSFRPPTHAAGAAHAHQAPPQPQHHAEHHDAHHLERLEEDQVGERPAGPVAEEQVAAVTEHQGQESAEQALERALEQERAADEPVGGPDQPHDRDLAGPLEQGEPDGDTDDHHRHRGEGQPDQKKTCQS